MNERFKKMLEGKPKAGKKPADRKRGQWFAQQIRQAPRCCQECDKPLAGTMAINPAAIVAHILPKRERGGCPSVATHPLNVVYLCGDCHTNMDNQGAAWVKKMRLFPLMRERVAQMWAEIAAGELKNVPDHFKP